MNNQESTYPKYYRYRWIFFLLFPLMMKGFKPEEIGEKTAPIILPIDGQLTFKEQKIKLEVARNQQTIIRGLTYRDNIPENRGMAYQSDFTPQSYFSGKGNKFDTELLFLDGNKVIDIQRVTACKEQKCLQHRTNQNYDTVVEVKAGTVNRLGLVSGDRVELDILPSPSG